MRIVAEGALAEYRLSPVERFEEVEQLALVIHQAIEAHLDALAHRRIG